MSALQLDAPTERVAVNLLRHLEWQADSFSLVFLFADVGPALQLADWLDQRLVLEGQTLNREEASDRFVQEPEAAVDRLIERLPELSKRSGGTWFVAVRHPRDEQWNRARRLYLARLNERRFLLERDLARPLVIVLPADFRSEVRAIAPDIWHVRAMSEELRSSAVTPAVVVDLSRAPTVRIEADAASPTPLFDAWRRASAKGTIEGAYLPTALVATKELLDAGRPADAELVARDAVALARRRAKANVSSEAHVALRDLSVSLNNLGRVAQSQGDWSGAESVYRESLALCRQLVERLGGTPEALRDLSVALNNLGRVAQAQGDGSAAESVYRESLALSRQLVERLRGAPEALRDLSVSLNNLGGVAEAQGGRSGAESVYRESLALSRQLVERLGDTPEALRDLSVSLDNVGRVAQAQGDGSAAESVYRESLALSRQLVERLGGTPEALRDLSVSLDNVGRVAQAQGDWSAAESVYRESLALRRQLVERHGGTPEALRDLSVSLDNVGRVAQSQGDGSGAESVYRESLALRRQLAERLGGTPAALRDLSVSLDNVGRVAQSQADWSGAESVYREGLALRRQLVERLGGTPAALDDLAFSLLSVSALPKGDPAARAEALEIRRTLVERFPMMQRYKDALEQLTRGPEEARGEN